MGLLDGKLTVLRMSSSKNSVRGECPEPSNSCHTAHRHRHRKRRFHVHPRALGVGFIGYAAAPARPESSSSETAPVQAMSDQEAASDSNLDIVRQPALRGLRICAWVMFGLLMCIFRNQIADMLVLAGDVMPPYR